MTDRRTADRRPHRGLGGAIIASGLLLLGVILTFSAIRPGPSGTGPSVPNAEDPTASSGSAPRAQVIRDFGRIDRAARIYLERHGRWPRDLAELTADPATELGAPPIDPYSRETYHCERLETGFRIVCFGADRARGGSGPAADLVLTVGGVA